MTDIQPAAVKPTLSQVVAEKIQREAATPKPAKVASDGTPKPGQPIALSLIDESPFNPRKIFTGIEELASSIAELGLQQPVLLRPSPKKAGRFELVFGARRLRALRHNKAPDVVNYDCRALSDAEAKAVQIVENLQREDVSALEEAEGFLALHTEDPKTWTAQAIAKKVGKTDRFVQQRLAIARGLSEPLKKRFADGEISVEVARTLAPLPKAVQADIPQWAIEDGSAHRVRQEAFKRCVPESAAKFDLALYKGEWIEDDKKRKYFFDTAQFLKLQKPAADKTLEEVKKVWPKAELITAAEAEKLYWADQDWAYSSGAIAESVRNGDVPARFVVPKERCRAVVWIAANGQIRKALGVVTEGQIAAANNARRETRNSAPSQKPEPAARKKARNAFNAAIAKAFAKPPKDLALRLQLLQRLAKADGLDSRQTELLPPAIRGYNFNRWSQRDKDRAEIWQAVAAMTPAAIASTLSKLALSEVPKWDERVWRQTPPLMVAIGATLGVALPDELKGKPKPAAKKKAAKEKHL